MANEVIIGWLRSDGTVTYDRDEITDNLRKVVNAFQHSPGFKRRVSRAYDEVFRKERPL